MTEPIIIQNEYRNVQLIGKGGMGDVYRAKQTSVGRWVAIKSLKKDFTTNESFRRRFKREAEVLATLNHPGIVALYDYVEQDDQLYIIMEYAQGQALDDFMASKSGKLNEDTAIKIMCNVLEALDYAHRKKIIHRDIKPSNIIVADDLSVKILDFGIAKVLEETQEHQLTKTKTAIGTVYYMSPEQIRLQSITSQSDLYALGVVLFYMLQGDLPYFNLTSEYDIQKAIVEEKLPLIKHASTKANQLIQTLTAKSPSERSKNLTSIFELLNNEKKTIIVKPVLAENQKPDKHERAYYFLMERKEYGPYSLFQIEKMIDKHKINPFCFIKHSSESDYGKRNRIKDLID